MRRLIQFYNNKSGNREKPGDDEDQFSETETLDDFHFDSLETLIVTIQHHQSFLLVLFCYCPVTFLSNRFSLTQHSALVVSFLTSAWCIASSNLGRLPQSHSLRTSLTEDYKHALVAESFTVINNSLIQRSEIKIRTICSSASKKRERQPSNHRTNAKPNRLN